MPFSVYKIVGFIRFSCSTATLKLRVRVVAPNASRWQT
jgi:hypothetical protein